MKTIGKISTVDDEKKLAFGWASVSEKDGVLVTDSDGDIIPISELEKAAYDFVEIYRAGGEMHEKNNVARLIESVVFTPEKFSAMGIAATELPLGWWVGFKISDDDVWQKVKSGEYNMFSIGGKAVRQNG